MKQYLKQFKVLHIKETDLLIRTLSEADLKLICSLAGPELDRLPLIINRADTMTQANNLIRTLCTHTRGLWRQFKGAEQNDLLVVKKDVSLVARVKTKHSTSKDDGKWIIRNFWTNSRTIQSVEASDGIAFDYVVCFQAMAAEPGYPVKPYSLTVISKNAILDPKNRHLVKKNGTNLVLHAPLPSNWDLYIVWR